MRQVSCWAGLLLLAGVLATSWELKSKGAHWPRSRDRCARRRLRQSRAELAKGHHRRVLLWCGSIICVLDDRRRDVRLLQRVRVRPTLKLSPIAAGRPTWQQLTRQASRLQSVSRVRPALFCTSAQARVNIDIDGSAHVRRPFTAAAAGEDLAQHFRVLDRGVPAVVLFDDAVSPESYETLMCGSASSPPTRKFRRAGDTYPLSRLLKRVYRATKGRELAVDRQGYFLKVGH